MKQQLNNSNPQSRGWCLTLNNYSAEDKKKLEELSTRDSVLFLAAQSEIGKQGTKHLQIYIEGKNSIYFDRVKSMFPTAHIEKRLGTPYEAFKYCLKDESRDNEYGFIKSENEPKKAYSKSKDWYELCQGCPTLYEFQREYERVYILNKRSVNEYYSDMRRIPKFRDMQVTVLFGGTGIGKTSYVFEKEPDLYVKDHTKWGDGYIGQPAVLIDEYAGQGEVEYLLTLLQGRPMPLQVKGSYVPSYFTRVYLTSNLKLEEWYHGASKFKHDITFEQLQALDRRITSILTRDSFASEGRNIRDFDEQLDYAYTQVFKNK